MSSLLSNGYLHKRCSPELFITRSLDWPYPMCIPLKSRKKDSEKALRRSGNDIASFGCTKPCFKGSRASLATRSRQTAASWRYKNQRKNRRKQRWLYMLPHLLPDSQIAPWILPLASPPPWNPPTLLARCSTFQYAVIAKGAQRARTWLANLGSGAFHKRINLA